MYKFYDKDLADQAAKEMGLVDTEPTRTLFKMRKHSIFLDHTVHALCVGLESCQNYIEAKKAMRDTTTQRIRKVDEAIAALNKQMQNVQNSTTTSERTMETDEMRFSDGEETILLRKDREEQAEREEAERMEQEEEEQDEEEEEELKMLKKKKKSTEEEDEGVMKKEQDQEERMDMDTSPSSSSSSYHQRNFEGSHVY